MFFPRSTPPRIREADLAELRLSLNAPVVSTEALPPGPARAAIALVREQASRFILAIGVRSLRTGETVVFTPEEPYPDTGAAAVGVDAALSFAEGMGFLFDDDELAAAVPDARDRAFARWCELLGEPHEEPAGELHPTGALDNPDEPFELVLGGATLASESAPPTAEAFVDELVLEDAVPDETLLLEHDPGPRGSLPAASLEDESAPAGDGSRFDGAAPTLEEACFELEPEAPAPIAEAPARATTAAAAPAPRVAARPGAAVPPGRVATLPLTKFRRGAEPANPLREGAVGKDAEAAASGGAPAAQPPTQPPTQRSAVLMTKHGPALGRLQLVKRRRDPEGAPQPSWLQRLLGSF